MTRNLLTALGFVLLGVLSNAACAAPEDEDAADESGDAISTDAILPEGAHTLLEKATASDAAVKQLGVQAWSVHLINDKAKGNVAALLVGTNVDDQVAYAVVVSADQKEMNADHATVSFVRYGDTAIAADQTFDDATRQLLSAETTRVSALVDLGDSSSNVRTLGNGTNRAKSALVCAAPLVVGLLAGAAVGAAGAAILASANLYTMVGGIVLSAGAPVVGGGVAIVGTGIAFAFKGWRNSCRVAIRGR